MANRYANAKAPKAGAMKGRFSEDSAPMAADRFTTGGRKTPNHNPPQPHLGLPAGPHTHTEGRKAVHEQFGVKMSAPARKPRTQATLETPKPTRGATDTTGKSMKTTVKSDADNASQKGFPKGGKQ